MTDPDRDDDAGYPNPRYAWYVVSVLTVAYLLSFLDRQILALLVEPIRSGEADGAGPNNSHGQGLDLGHRCSPGTGR